MNLFFSPGACSFAPHVVMNELGMDHTLVRVDMSKKKTADGRDFLAINPKGYVPTIEMDGGKVMTEGVAIMQYLADQKPESGLVPKFGTMERYELMEMMNFITTEIHKGFTPLFGPGDMVQNAEGIEQLLASTTTKLGKRLGYVAGILSKRSYLIGDKVTIADIYLMTVLRWAAYVKLDLSPWPSLTAFLERMQARPAVQAAIKAEGLKH